MNVVEFFHLVKDKGNPTEEELFNELKYGPAKMSSQKDHPKFTELRLQLEKDGFIKIEKGWWNGDRVLMPFMLNNKQFKIGDKFVCAGAMTGHLKFMK